MSVERAARNAGWYFGAHLARRVVHLAYPLYIAKKLGPRVWGDYWVFLTIVGLLPMLSGLGLNRMIIRRVNRDPRGTDDVIANCYSLNLCTATLVVLAVLAIIPTLGMDRNAAIALAIMTVSAIPLAGRQLMAGVAAAHEQLWIFAIIDNGGGMLEAIVGIALVWMGYRLITLCILYASLMLLANLIFRVLLKRRGIITRWRFAPREWIGYLRESWKFWTVIANQALYNRLGGILLRALGGAAKAGQFGLAWQAYQLIKVAAEGFSSAVFPFMVRAWQRSAEELKAFHRSTLRLLLTAGVPVGFIGLLLAGPLVQLGFSGGKYKDAVPVMQILAWFLYPHFYEVVAVRVCQASGRLMLPVLGHTLINVVNAGLSLLFITQMADEPHVGLAWARLSAVGFSFVVYTVLIGRYIYDLNPLASLGRALAASAVPTLMVIFLHGKIHVAVLTPMVLAAFAIGAWAARLLTAREIGILRRVLHMRKTTDN